MEEDNGVRLVSLSFHRFLAILSRHGCLNERQNQSIIPQERNTAEVSAN